MRKAKDKDASFASATPKAPKVTTAGPAKARPRRRAPSLPEPEARPVEANGPRPSKRAASSKRSPRPKVVVPEEMLARAISARTPRSRALWARRGLSARGPLERTTQALLLRQLYLAYYEEERFEAAVDIAERVIELDVLPDVAHQDAARAKQAQGDIEGAASHLRLAARLGPPNRKAFHWWTLGSLFYVAGRYDEAIAAMARAARWGTTDKPLYQGHLALARIAAGPADEVPLLGELIAKLEAVPAGSGYGRFVLGLLALHAGRAEDARRWLSAFVERSTGGRRALSIALRGEVELAREALVELEAV